MSTDATTGAVLCTNGSGTAVAWVSVPPFDVSQLDYGQAGEAFAAGFVMIGSCVLLGRAIAAIFKAIK